MNTDPNPPPLNHRFNRGNAREMARRSWTARRQREADRKALEAAQVELQAAGNEDAAITATKKQIATLDRELDAALDAKNFKLAAAIASTKARLWPLARPTAGVRKSIRERRPALREL
jgi:hypothetical protein